MKQKLVYMNQRKSCRYCLSNLLFSCCLAGYGTLWRRTTAMWCQWTGKPLTHVHYTCPRWTSGLRRWDPSVHPFIHVFLSVIADRSDTVCVCVRVCACVCVRACVRVCFQKVEVNNLDVSDDEELRDQMDMHTIIISCVSQEPLFTAEQVQYIHSRPLRLFKWGPVIDAIVIFIMIYLLYVFFDTPSITCVFIRS